jgi:hypothetical protein
MSRNGRSDKFTPLQSAAPGGVLPLRPLLENQRGTLCAELPCLFVEAVVRYRPAKGVLKIMPSFYSYTSQNLFEILIRDFTTFCSSPSTEGLIHVVFSMYHLREWILKESEGKSEAMRKKAKTFCKTLCQMREYELVRAVCNHAKHFEYEPEPLDGRMEECPGARAGMMRAGDSLSIVHFTLGRLGVIAKGKLRGDRAKLVRDLETSGNKGERAELVELRGFDSDNITGGFTNAEMWAGATDSMNPFYHLDVRLAADEEPCRQQWLCIAERFEKELGFEGQGRAIAFHHLPDGSTHMKIAWTRIDTEDMRAINPSLYKHKLKEISRKLEREHPAAELRDIFWPVYRKYFEYFKDSP